MFAKASHWRRALIVALCLGLLVVALGAATVSAAPSCTTTCFVDVVNGDDTNSGTAAGAGNALKTIQVGVTQVNSGGTVIVAPGTYPENVTIPKSLTLTGADDNADPLIGTILDGTGLNGTGIFINSGITDVTIEDLRVQDYIGTSGSGIWGNQNNHNFVAQNLTADNNGVAGASGGGIYLNGIGAGIDNVLITGNTVTNNKTRGIVIWNGFKTNITITNNTVSGNNCCGIELQDGTASGVTVTGNTVENNIDSGMAFIGLTGGVGPNLIADNTLVNNGRFGIEIKLPNGTGSDTGVGSIVVEDNDVSLTATPADLRDYAGIAAFRRSYLVGNPNGNVSIPTGVIIRNNTVSGYAQTNGASFSEGFGIVVEGTNMHVSGNTLTNNDVGVQVQAGHTPYTGLGGPTDEGNQNNVADTYFGRGNSPVGCAAIGVNTFSGNTVNSRTVGPAGGLVTNLDTAETFCTIQAAINDAQTLNGHTLEASAGTYAESPNVTKSLTIQSADGRDATTIDLQTGPTYLGALTIDGADVTIDGFTIEGFDAANPQLASTNLVVTNSPDSVVIKNNRFKVGQVDGGSNGDDGFGILTTYSETNDVGSVVVEDNLFVPLAAAGQRAFYVNPGVDVFEFRGNDISGNFAASSLTQAKDGLVEDNTVTGNGTSRGLGTWGYPDPTVYGHTVFTGNTISDVVNGITLFGSESVSITKNTFTGNDRAVYIPTDDPVDLTTIHINRNSIDGNTMGVENEYASEVDAICNWWGAADGPGPVGPGSGDPVSANVDFDPWLTSTDLDAVCPLPPAALLYVSPNAKNGVVDGVAYNDQDILVNTLGTSDWEMYFDGSTFGINKNLTDFTFDPTGCLLLTFNGNQKLGSVTYTPQDVAKFCPTTPGNYTAGTFTMYFDGSDVGLSGSAEIIDALELLPDGRLVISTKGNASVPGTAVTTLKAQKNDLLAFDYTAYGSTTSGTWSLYFDNASVAGFNKENIISSYMDNGDIYMTFWDNFTVGDETGDFNDIVVIHPDDTADVFWDANDWGYTGRIHGLHMVLND